MQFGLLYETQRPFSGTEIDWNNLYKETLEQCELADQVGFDALWFVEHHFLTRLLRLALPRSAFRRAQPDYEADSHRFWRVHPAARASCPHRGARGDGGPAHRRAR